MAQELAIAAKGLVTAPNPLLVPKDALTTALNLIIDRPGFIQSRRGFDRATGALGGSIWRLFVSQGKLWANWGNATTASSLSYYDGSTSWTTLSGTFSNASNARMRTADANGNTYATTSSGVFRLDSGFAATSAGMPKALGIDAAGPAAVLSTSTPRFLSDGYCVAYRAIIGTKDAGGNLLLGAPSSRTIIANSSQVSGYSAGSAAQVTCRVLLPKQNNSTTDLTTSYFVQLYRSAQVANGTTPSDELQQVFEGYLSSTNISNGYIDIVDGTPDAQRGGYLYTNEETGDDGVTTGVAGVANEPPPIGREVAYWRNCLWLGRTTGRQHLSFQILGVGSGGLAAGDTLTIAGVTYTAIAPGAPAANQFVVDTTATASENIARAAQNLVTAINKSASNSTIYAYYVSGDSPDAPGKIYLETRALSGSGFTAVASASGSTGYLPSLASAVSSSADAYTNRLMFSRGGLPEAFPPLNTLSVGPTDATILRAIPLQDSLFVFTDRGLYRVTGDDYSDFRVREFDSTAILFARECVAALDDDLYAWCENGILRINEAGVESVSRDIDFDLVQLMKTATRDVLDRHAFLVAQPADHRLLLWCPRTSSDSIARFAYCLNIQTLAWTKWQHADVSGNPDGRSCGAYSTVDRLLYLADAQNADGYIYAEKRGFVSADYKETLSDGAAYGMTRTATWATQDGGNAGLLKQWTEAQFLFGDSPPTAMSITFATEFASESVSPAGSGSLRMQRMPVGVAAGRGTRLAVTLSNSEQNQGFDVSGLSVFFRPLSSRGMK